MAVTKCANNKVVNSTKITEYNIFVNNLGKRNNIRRIGMDWFPCVGRYSASSKFKSL